MGIIGFHQLFIISIDWKINSEKFSIGEIGTGEISLMKVGGGKVGGRKVNTSEISTPQQRSL